MQNMMRGGKSGGTLKKCKVRLMKDHFSLSKAFSRSIFRIMWHCLPFIF